MAQPANGAIKHGLCCPMQCAEVKAKAVPALALEAAGKQA